MDYRKDFVTTKKVKDGCVLYHLKWAEPGRVNRHLITRSVPARSGIFELYYEDDAGRMKLFHMERVWYGGLRSEIRRASDPLTVSDGHRRVVLSRNKCWYRYTIVDSHKDMADLLHYFSLLLLPSSVPPPHSGRYEEILVEEEPERKPLHPG